MATLHPDLHAGRSDVFLLDPDKLTLVTDPDSPLYDPRVHNETDESLVRNIMVYGVLEPVIIRKNGDVVEVVAGRGRVKAALEANRRLEAEGKQPIRVPAVLRRGPDADMFGVLISENEIRRDDNPLTKADKALRLINMGKSEEEVAVTFGVSKWTVKSWLALQDLASPVREAVERGQLSTSAAAELSSLNREEQVQALENMQAEGEKLTVRRARSVTRDSAATLPVPKMRTRKAVEEMRYKFQCTLRTSEGCLPVGKSKEYDQGFYDALSWILFQEEAWADGGEA